MAETLEWQNPGDYQLIKAELVLSGNERIDIREHMAYIEIYEDIFMNYMTCSFKLMDLEGMFESKGFTGEEKLNFSFKTSDVHHEHTKTFDITKISEFDSGGDFDRYYSFKGTTEGAFKNENTRISKSYSGRPEDIIGTILEKTMEMIPSDWSKMYGYDITKYDRDMVVPNWKPYRLFNYLGSTSIDGFSDNDYDTGYIFYENSVGYQFRHLRNLYEENEPFEIFERVSGVKGDLETATSHKVEQVVDHLTNAMTGAYANTIIEHDIINKKITTTTNSYNEDREIKDPMVYNREYSPNNRVTMMSSNYDMAKAKYWGAVTDRDKRLFDGFKINLVVPGNSNITVGQTVKYKMASCLMTEEWNKTHKRFPQKFLITAVRHSISVLSTGESEYNQVLELRSDRWVE